MQYNVMINGKVVPIHAKNEAQLKFAIEAIKRSQANA